MKRNVLLVMMVLVMCAMSVHAGTVAYWRFEDGTAGTDVQHLSGSDGVYSADIADVSGNGNDLSAWSTGGGPGYGYRSDVGLSTVPQTGATNNLSVKNTGGVPGMFTQTGSGVSTMTPVQWTIEASFKLENGGNKTIIGRDSRGSVLYNGGGQEADLAALYLQVVGNNALAIKFCDAEGYWHVAQSADGAYQGFNWGEDPDGVNAPWYSIAAVSDGSTLSLYLTQIGTGGWNLIAETDLTLSGSTNTALTAGAGDGGDWDAGNWTVGRGLFAGGHGDRAYGFIDEVRISDSALAVSEFLVPEPATLMLLGLGAMILRRKK
jgi:hypothetical protein